MEFIPPWSVSRFVRFARWLCGFPISRAGRWLFERRPSWLGLVRRLLLRRAGTWLVDWLPSWLGLPFAHALAVAVTAAHAFRLFFAHPFALSLAHAFRLFFAHALAVTVTAAHSFALSLAHAFRLFFAHALAVNWTRSGFFWRWRGFWSSCRLFVNWTRRRFFW